MIIPYLVMLCVRHPINLSQSENLHEFVSVDGVRPSSERASIEEEQAEMARILEDMKQFREKAINR